MPKVAIIGGGISGLALAYRLRQYLADVDIQILESDKNIGGKISSIHEQGFIYESGPNGFLDSNPSTLNLSKELGLSSQLSPANDAAAKNRFLLLGGKLRLLPSSFIGLLTTDVLSLRAKFSLAMERFQPRKQDSSDESIYAFAQRRVGTEIAEKLVDPFVTGIYAGDARQVSYQAGFPGLPQWKKIMGAFPRVSRHREKPGLPPILKAEDHPDSFGRLTRDWEPLPTLWQTDVAGQKSGSSKHPI